MNRVKFSGMNASGSEVWTWYQNSRIALLRYGQILLASKSASEPVPNEFFGLTPPRGIVGSL
jgi:hypothetical protein